MSIGRVKFYLVEKAFGFITAEDGTEIFFHRNDLSGAVAAADIQRDMPVVFDVREKDGKRYAAHVRTSNDADAVEAAYSINRFQGRVTSWRGAGAGMCGFIGYLEAGQKRSIFFHISDVNAAADGVQYEPVEGCLVDFERGMRHGKEIAKDIFVTEWPQVEQTVEEYFLSVEPESEPQPEPVPVELQSELLSSANRTKSLLQIIQERKQK